MKFEVESTQLEQILMLHTTIAEGSLEGVPLTLLMAGGTSTLILEVGEGDSKIRYKLPIPNIVGPWAKRIIAEHGSPALSSLAQGSTDSSNVEGEMGSPEVP